MSHRNRYRAERRQRLAAGLARLSLWIGVLGTTAFYSYHVGIEVMQDELAALTAGQQQDRQAATSAAAELARLRGELAAAHGQARHFQALYESSQPSSEAGELLRLIEDKLGAGLPRERLAFFIQAAEAPTRCGEVAARTLAVRVGSRGGQELRFGEAGKMLAVTAQGEPDPTVKGHRFDPGKPVTLRFAPADGKASEVSGLLPLKHVVLTRSYEQRFTITAGPKGTLQVSGDRCDFRSG